jgi:hypothetical protein
MSKNCKVKTGGSAASEAVVNLVPPSAFENLSSMFSNLFYGGSKNTNTNKVLSSLDMNEKPTQKMFIHSNSNITGGKKPKSKAKKTVKPKPKKGGSSITPIINKPIPNGTVPEPSSSGLSMKGISPSQQFLASQDISSMKPVMKATVFPSSYSGSFSFGGAKTKKTQKTKKTKKN